MSQKDKNDSLITPVFKTEAVQDMEASKKAGRPIFVDKELVEVHIAGDRDYRPVFGALDFWKHIDGIAVTYAERWSEQYQLFKEGKSQITAGTPVDELPFLNAAKRAELKALRIYTAETLAALDGKNLKTLGLGGRELKDQAQAYLDRATGSAKVVELAQENAAIKAQMEELRAQLAEMNRPAPVVETEGEEAIPDEFDGWDADSLKGFIQELTGKRPVGNPSIETLKRMAGEAQQKAAA